VALPAFAHLTPLMLIGSRARRARSSKPPAAVVLLFRHNK